MLKAINKERRSRGIEEVEIDPDLQRLAMLKAADMVENDYFNHVSPVYGNEFAMASDIGVKGASAANIAAGSKDVPLTMEALMNSPGHKGNILSPSSTKVGIGYAEGKAAHGVYWSQIFGD